MHLTSSARSAWGVPVALIAHPFLWVMENAIVLLPLAVILSVLYTAALPTGGSSWMPFDSAVYVVSSPEDDGVDGFRPGDIVWAVDDSPIRTIPDLQSALYEAAATVSVYRQGAEHVIDPAPPAEILQRVRLTDLTNVLMVQEVFPGGPADVAGIEPGDIITKVNGRELTSSSIDDPVRRWNLGRSHESHPPAAMYHSAQAAIEESLVGSSVTYETLHVGSPKTVSFSTQRLGLGTYLSNLLSRCYQSLKTGFVVFFAALGIIVIWHIRAYDKSKSGVTYFLCVCCSIVTLLLWRPYPVYGAYCRIIDLAIVLILIAAVVTLVTRAVGGSIKTWMQTVATMGSQRPIVVISILWAAGLTLLLGLWYVLYPAAESGAQPTGAAWMLERLLGRGLVSYLLIFVFILALHHTAQVARLIVLPMAPGRSRVFEGVATHLGWSPRLRLTPFHSQHMDRLLTRAARSPERIDIDRYITSAVEQEETKCTNSFVVIGWCEMALPVLGFIGTVIGLSDALPALSEVLVHAQDTVSAGAASDTLQAAGALSTGGRLDQLQGVFLHLAVAFDTTLIGLIMLLIVGLNMTSLKRRCLAYLEELDTDLRDVGDRLVTSSAAGELRALRDVVLRNESLLEAMVEEGRSPAWQEMRFVLHKWLVEFPEKNHAEISPPTDGTQKWGTWWISSIALPRNQQGVGLAIAKSGDRTVGLLSFQMTGRMSAKAINDDLRGILPLPGTSKALVRLTSGGCGILDGTMDRPSVSSSDTLQQGRCVALATVDTESEHVGAVVMIDQAATHILSLRITDSLSVTPATASLHTSKFDVKHAMFDTSGRVLWLAGIDLTKSWAVKRYVISNANNAGVSATETGSTRVTPEGATPRLVVPMRQDRVIAITQDNRVLSWTEGNAEFIDATPINWPAGDISVISDGSIYLAVFDWNRKELSMWRMSGAGDRLWEVPRGNGEVRRLAINAVSRHALDISADGSAVYAAAGHSIIGWRFPRRSDDQLRRAPHAS